ncbi:MAG: G5 domain-containing protein [Clostridia bacterium]|nr:G5 domain-containing protein [Clostridia bacterium]
MFNDNNSRTHTRPHTKLKSNKKRRNNFFANLNFHGLNNKKFLRALPCICFVITIGFSLAILASYTSHHSYYRQEDASIQTTRFAARNDIFEPTESVFEVSVHLNGSTIPVTTGSVTVDELITTLNIDMDGKQTDIPGDTLLTESTELHIHEVDYHVTTETEIIPYDTEIVEVSTIPYGTTKVVTRGVNGSVTKTVKQKLVGGKVEGEAVTNEKTVAPVTEVIYKGVGGTFVGDDGVTYRYSHYVDVEATAYTAPEGAITYSGYEVDMSCIAVDPRYIPLGSKVYVASDYYDCGVRYARDTGGAIKGYIIDIFMGYDDAAEEQAVQWGRRGARVYYLIEE